MKSSVAQKDRSVINDVLPVKEGVINDGESGTPIWFKEWANRIREVESV